MPSFVVSGRMAILFDRMGTATRGRRGRNRDHLPLPLVRVHLRGGRPAVAPRPREPRSFATGSRNGAEGDVSERWGPMRGVPARAIGNHGPPRMLGLP